MLQILGFIFLFAWLGGAFEKEDNGSDKNSYNTKNSKDNLKR